MAQIVTITNPLTGQPTQVDQLEHTAQQIDDGLNIARGVSDPNLLDNWYFGNPVNQRGQTSYTGAGYGIDRWYSTGVCLIESDGMTIMDSIFERIQNTEKLNGLTITFSVLGANGKLYTGTRVFNYANDVIFYVQDSDGIQLLFNKYWNGFQVVGNFKAKAAKLELGPTQTLAHQENGVWVLNEIPDYGEQLVRCQRYYRQFNAYTKFVAQYIDSTKVVFVLPVSMRTAPSMSGTWRIHTGFTEQTGFTLNTYQTGNIIVVEAVKANHGLSSAWLGVDGSGVGILNAEL